MSLESDALQLAELDRQVVRAFVEANREELGRALGAYLTLRKNLNARLLDDPVAVVEDTSAREVLRKISTGQGLPSDDLIEQIWARTGEEGSILDFDNADIEELGSNLLYSWFSHYEYVRGLSELRPLILRRSVPESVSNLVRQVRDCYAFQQYDAAYALCRMVIEGSIREICVRRELFRDLGADVPLFENYNWRRLRDTVCTGPLNDRLNELYKDLSVLIHTRKTVSQREARDAFEETLLVVERLYEEHGL